MISGYIKYTTNNYLSALYRCVKEIAVEGVSLHIRNAPSRGGVQARDWYYRFKHSSALLGFVW
jgi:hypothetical protein